MAAKNGRNERNGVFIRGKVYWCRDPLDNGNQVSTGLKDEETAIKWYQERKRISETPAYQAASKARFSVWYTRILEVKKHQRSADTVQMYVEKLGHMRRLWGDDFALFHITPKLCDEYLATRRAETACDNTVCKEFNCLFQMLKLARRDGCYPHDIAALKPFGLTPKYVPRKRALRAAEIQKLLGTCNPRLGAFVRITVALGLRLSEALRLQPSDINLGENYVRVRGTKTDQSDAVLPILTPAKPLVEAALPYLPLVKFGRINRDLAAACKRVDIVRATPNDLRRSNATFLAEAGVPIEYVRRMLRHANSVITETVYAQPEPAALAAVIEPHLAGRSLLATVSATVGDIGQAAE